jgi:DNA-binding transcriptional MocR family regulator
MPAASIDFKSAVPLYRQMVDDMRRRFAEGDFPAGTVLPSSPVLEHEYGLSRDTVRRAVNELRDLGYVVAVKGANWRASDPLPGNDDPEVVLLPPGADVRFVEATEDERRRFGLPRGASMAVVHFKAVTRSYPVSRVRFKVPWNHSVIESGNGQ